MKNDEKTLLTLMTVALASLFLLSFAAYKGLSHSQLEFGLDYLFTSENQE